MFAWLAWHGLGWGTEQSTGLSSIIQNNFPVTNIECQDCGLWLGQTRLQTFQSSLFITY